MEKKEKLISEYICGDIKIIRNIVTGNDLTVGKKVTKIIEERQDNMDKKIFVLNYFDLDTGKYERICVAKHVRY